jgi:hypothetical protein
MKKRKVKETIRYEIDSFEKLLNIINEDNFGSLSMCLLKWLKYHTLLMKQYREKYPEYAKDKSNWELGKITFIWIDDGKDDLKFVSIKNELTGQVTQIELI